MATALLSPVAKQYFPTNSGAPAAGYKLYTYAANTTTPQATYTNRAGTVANQNPIILDARGEAIIYLTPGVVYDYHLYTDQDALEYTREDVIADAGDANAVNFLQSGTGAVSRSSQDKMRERLSVKDFGAVGDGVSNDTVAIQTAVTSAITTGRLLHVPDGTYRLTATITAPDRLAMTGCGADPDQLGGSWFHFDHSGKGFDFTPGAGTQTFGNAIRKIGTKRTHPAPSPGWVPTFYDWDFYCSQTGGGDHLFEDVFLLNANKGIIASGRSSFIRIRGQAFDTFIHAPFNADTTRYESCHFWPFWSADANVMAYMLDNAIAYRMVRVDNPVMVNTFSFGAKTGLEIGNDGLGTTFKLRITNCDFDGCRNGIQILASADNCTMSVDNFQSQSAFPITGGGIGIHVLADNCRINLDNTVLGFHRQNAIRVEGTGNDLRIGTMEIENYDESAGGFSAVECAAGNSVYFAGRPRITRVGGYTSPKFSGAGTINAPLNYGQFSGTTSAGGDVTVTHSSNVAPRNIVLTMRAPDVDYILRVESEAANTFTVRVRNSAGVVVNTLPVTFNWRADF